MQTKKTTLFSLIILLIFFLFIRVINIHSTPAVISHDEIYYPTEAKSLVVSGHDTSGTWNPLKLTAANPLYAELPGTIMAPAAFLFQNDPIMSAKATHILLGTLLLFLIAGVSYNLTKSKGTAFATLIIAGFNPWLFQFSRMGFDALLSLFFYFAAILTMLKFKGNKKIFSLIFWFLGFYQYQGLKVIFIPLIILTLIYIFISENGLDLGTLKNSLNNLLSNKFKQSNKKEINRNGKRLNLKLKISLGSQVKSVFKKSFSLLIILTFTSAIFLSYIFRLKSQEAGGRVNDLIFSDTEYTVSNLAKQRQQAIDTKISKYVFNKPTVVGERFIKQYLAAFNIDQLFVTGESFRNPFSVWSHGIFYLFDILLIIVGFTSLISSKKTKLAGYYLTSLALIAPLPSAINAKGIWIMFRASLLFPVLIIFAGFGAYTLYKHLPKLISYLLIIIYFVFVARFFYQYFYVYPVIGTQGQYFSERIIASYIKRNPEQKIVVHAQEPRFVFESILVYNNLINKDNITQINTAFKNEEFSIGNFEVTGACMKNSNDPNTTFITNSTTQFCDSKVSDKIMLIDKNSRFNQIPSLLDSGGIYKIYNDQFCSVYDLSRFSHIVTNVFNVEKQSTEVFCRSFIIFN